MSVLQHGTYNYAYIYIYKYGRSKDPVHVNKVPISGQEYSRGCDAVPAQGFAGSDAKRFFFI